MMKPVHTLDDVKSTVSDHKITLLYISRPNCSVCHSLRPQVEELLENYPSVTSIHADAEEIPEIAGEYSIFTVPVVIVFVEGKEMLRKARFVPIDELDHQLDKMSNLIE